MASREVALFLAANGFLPASLSADSFTWWNEAVKAKVAALPDSIDEALQALKERRDELLLGR